VELNGRQVHFQQAHVLDDERIGAGFIQLPGQQAAAVELVIVQDGIERDKDLGAVAVGKIAQAFDIGDIVAGAITGAKGRATDVTASAPCLMASMPKSAFWPARGVPGGVECGSWRLST
jgi:hypothetical protein